MKITPALDNFFPNESDIKTHIAPYIDNLNEEKSAVDIISPNKNTSYLSIHKCYDLIIIGSEYPLESFEKRILIKKFKKVKLIKNLPDYLSSPEEVVEYVKHIINCHSPKCIVFNYSKMSAKTIISYMHGESDKMIEYYTGHELFEKYLKKCLVGYNEEEIEHFTTLTPFSKGQRIIKRATDIILAVLLLIISLPIWVYSALKIKNESPGPVFYIQKRICRYNREFSCIKFRSMKTNAEENGAQWAVKDDPRVFGYGEFMRKARVDELPQLLNVLRGELSMIGPRPERKIFTEVIEKAIAGYNKRHVVKPGITGWAQVNYPYGASLEDARQKLMYDLYYMKNWSIWLDIKIVFKTVETVLLRKGL